MMKRVDVPEFFVIGIAERTSNEREMSGRGVIGEQWDRLFKDEVLTRIPNRVDSSIVAVYTDYQGDHTGEYTFLLGARVSDLSTVPMGMVAKRIPAGEYAVLTSEQGQVVAVVVGAWQKIWASSTEELGGERAFQTDFEVYDERAQDPQNSQIDVYVGLK